MRLAENIAPAWMMILLCAAGADALGADSVLIDGAGKQPRAAVLPDGSVVVTYAVGETIVVRKSADSGKSYDKSITVAKIPKMMVGMRRGPHIAAAASGTVIAAIGEAGNIETWRSIDQGRTWSGPVMINDQATSAREGLFSLAADGKDTVHATWLDLRDGKSKIFISQSSDGGKTWSANELVYASPEGSVCECCQPTITATSDGSVAVMWRNQLAGNRDMYVSISHDGGKQFATAEKLGSGSWALAACPMDGGGITLDQGGVHAIWRRAGELFSATSPALGVETGLGSGKNGTVALCGKVVAYAWQNDQELLLKIGQKASAGLGKGAFPTLSSGYGMCMLTWQADDGVHAMPIQP
jgi:hypothetical protein